MKLFVSTASWLVRGGHNCAGQYANIIKIVSVLTDLIIQFD